MRLNAFMEGLEIFARHFNDTSGFHLAAEHDQFFLYKTDSPLTEEELEVVNELGWFQDEVPYDDETEERGPYDPDEGWSCFV